MSLELIRLTLGAEKKIKGFDSVTMPSQMMFDIKLERSHYKNGGTYIKPSEMEHYGIVKATKKEIEEIEIVEEVKPVAKKAPKAQKKTAKTENKKGGIPIPD